MLGVSANLERADMTAWRDVAATRPLTPRMADRYRAPGGWTVQVVRLSGTPNKRDGEWIRVCHYGYHVEGSGIAADGRGIAVAAACRAIEPIYIAPQQLLIRPLCCGLGPVRQGCFGNA